MVEAYHVAADEFSRGNPEPIKAVFSHGDDVTLANPFGPAARRWKEVSGALEFASSRFSDGNVASFENRDLYQLRSGNLSRARAVEGQGRRERCRRPIRSPRDEHVPART